MKLHELTSHGKKRRRLGRGISAGQGKTGGRGTKGQNSRTGKKLRAGFEGGQTPFFKRIPKLKGFTNPNHIDYQVVNVGDLELLEGSEITKEVLLAARVLRRKNLPVKVLGVGELTKKLTVRLDSASVSALEKITAVGGSFESTGRGVAEGAKAHKDVVYKPDES